MEEVNKYILIGVPDKMARLISEAEYNSVKEQLGEENMSDLVELGVMLNPTIDETIKAAEKLGYKLDLIII